MDIFNLMDSAMCSMLKVEYEEFDDVMENWCSEKEREVLITLVLDGLLEDDKDKIEEAKEMFNSKLKKREENT